MRTDQENSVRTTNRVCTAFFAALLLAASLAANTAPASAEGPTEPESGSLEIPPEAVAAVHADSTVQSIEIPSARAPREEKQTCGKSGKQKICIREIEPPAESQEDGDAPQSRSMVAYPNWCLDLAHSNHYSGTRTSTCAMISLALEVFDGRNVLVGTALYNLYNYVYMDTSQTTWVNQIAFSPYKVTGAASSISVRGTATCAGQACTAVRQSFPLQSPSLNGKAEGESSWKWTGKKGTSGVATPGWTVTFEAAAAPNSVTYLRSAPALRCDDAVPGRAAGCIVPAVTPHIDYDANYFRDFGDHVSEAQRSGLPGSETSGIPLHRTTNTALRDSNRSTACPASFPRPAGYSCDEYPFASTHEGASRSGGGPRTLDWCQISLDREPSTGRSGYSVCMINASENSRAGSLLNSTLFAPMRVVDGDPFFVNIHY